MFCFAQPDNYKTHTVNETTESNFKNLQSTTKKKGRTHNCAIDLKGKAQRGARLDHGGLHSVTFMGESRDQ